MSRPLAHSPGAAGIRPGAFSRSLTTEYPRDGLALQAGHQIDFFTGNARMLRDRMARALLAWDSATPGYHAMLGMQAFGFEEMGDYARAETLGRAAIELEPRDGWAQHAVAHVMEMQCRQRDGIAWMRANPENWTKESFLQIHNWWHLALFHYDLGEVDEVLALYDGPIYGSGSPLALNMVDASAILWRLHLGGVDVGIRWQRLADNWSGKAADANYAFNDIHAMMAFVGSGRTDLTRRLLDAQNTAMAAKDDNAAFTREHRPPDRTRHLEIRRRRLCRSRASDQPRSRHRTWFRRQPRPARRHRPDPHRGGNPRGRPCIGAGPFRRAAERAAGQPLVAYVRPARRRGGGNEARSLTLHSTGSYSSFPARALVGKAANED